MYCIGIGISIDIGIGMPLRVHLIIPHLSSPEEGSVSRTNANYEKKKKGRFYPVDKATVCWSRRCSDRHVTVYCGN